MVTTGAENDLVQVTRIARSMVGRWGMSDAIGPLTVLPEPDMAGNPFMPSEMSEHTQQLVDTEARRIVDECYVTALETLRDHCYQLDAIARALLDKETLDEIEAYQVAGIDRTTERPA